MNVFTLTAAGLVALGVPLAAPWLAQESAPSANAAVLAPAQVIDLRGAFASTTVAPLAPIAPLAPSSANVALPDTRPLLGTEPAAPSFTTHSLLSPQDDAAREIAELQARIAALQAEVAALSASTGRTITNVLPHGSPELLRIDTRAGAALESALKDQTDSLAEIETLVERGRMTRAQAAEQRAAAEARVLQALELARAAQDYRAADVQAEGERRRVEREAQRARAEAQRGRAEAQRERQFAELEQQRAWLESSAESFESAAEEQEEALDLLEEYMDENELSDLELDTLARQRAEIQSRVEEFLAQARAQEDMFDHVEDQLDALDWDDARLSAVLGELGYVDTQELEELGYISDEACEECEEDPVGESVRAANIESAVTEEWLAQARASFGDSTTTGWPADARGGALPRSSNGDVIVNVGGGGGGHDAEIVDLLREIRDEVRGLREDLRNLHGTPMPAAPRAPRGSRSDFGYAPNSSSGPGVATGGGFDQGVDPFGWPQATAPQAEEFPTSGNLYGDAPSAPSGGDSNALSSVEIRAPRAIRQPAPLIDAALRAAGPATVHVNLLVNEAGAVANAAVKSSTDARFEQAALDAVTQWVFAPGSIDGQPNAMFVDVPIVFPSTGK